MKTLLMLSRRTKESEVLRELLIIFPILLAINVVDSTLVEFPNNIAVPDATSRTKFRCKSDEAYELKWFMQANNTAQRQVLSFGNEIKNDEAKSYCSIENKDGGEFNLILTIKDESAQTYTCQEPDTNQERSAELIKMEPTKFDIYMNESHVTLNCSVKFKGNWAPELELSHNGASVVDGADVFVVPNQNVSTTLVIPRNDNAMAGKYTCTVRFDLKGKPQRTTDNSVPRYMNTSILTVHVKEIHPDIPDNGNSEGSSSHTIAIVCFVAGVVVVVVVGIAAIIMRKEHAAFLRCGHLPCAKSETTRQRSQESERSSNSADSLGTTRYMATDVALSCSRTGTPMPSNGVGGIGA